MLFEFYYNYKIPTSGEYISDRRRTNPDLCAGGGEWGLTLIGALYYSPSLLKIKISVIIRTIFIKYMQNRINLYIFHYYNCSYVCCWDSVSVEYDVEVVSSPASSHVPEGIPDSFVSWASLIQSQAWYTYT